MITNLINDMKYIGKDQNDNPQYMGSGILLWNSYRKRFGRQDLDSSKRTHHKWVYKRNLELNIYKKTILDTCSDKETLCELEKYYIQKYNTIRPNGYNIADGGEGGYLTCGYSEEEKNKWKELISQKTKEAMHKPEIREKFMECVNNRGESWRNNISKSLKGHKGHPLSEEHKKRLSQINKGNQYGLGNKSRTGQHISEEQKQKMSESLKKIKHTQEWNDKVSKSLKGKPKSEEHKQALRKPKPKYQWLLPDGSLKIMDASNGSRHKDWIKLERIS